MKRSEINNIMKESLSFLDTMNFLLPPFATWSPADWKQKGKECIEIVEQQLGWDITDFGYGDFSKTGLFMFTIRNGTVEELKKEAGKVYAEKILIVKENQLTPIHFHYQKMEDIINRGGGKLLLQFWRATEDEGLSDKELTLSFDGVRKNVKAGGTVSLSPGESVCIPQKVYHNFWGAEGEGTVLVGEVSRVNNDYIDNRFYEAPGRFPEIEEDEKPLYLLYDDYKDYYKYA
jgi:D-lyxose ketol-isomerase